MTSISSEAMRRALWRVAVGTATCLSLPLRARDHRIAVFYGGARAGDFGGPLVKLRLLRQRFPQHQVGFSLVYLLSNAIYLPQRIVKAIGRSGIPIVLNQNGVFYPGWFPHGWEQENARIAGVHALATHVLYQSEFCRRCANQFLGARSGSQDILYNAVDTGHFRPVERPPGRRPFTFLLTGTIGPSTAYRLTSSIEGLAAARRGGLDARLTIAGRIDPAVEAQARALAARRDVDTHVAFAGPYTAAGAPAIYQAVDAYLITKHNDPCPNVVLEALASGLPVLYSASGGVPELVGEEAGVGLPVPDTFDETPAPAAEAIAEGMGRVMREHEAMGRAARARAVTRFDLAPWLERHENLFARLVQARLAA